MELDCQTQQQEMAKFIRQASKQELQREKQKNKPPNGIKHQKERKKKKPRNGIAHNPEVSVHAENQDKSAARHSFKINSKLRELFQLEEKPGINQIKFSCYKFHMLKSWHFRDLRNST